MKINHEKYRQPNIDYKDSPLKLAEYANLFPKGFKEKVPAQKKIRNKVDVRNRQTGDK